MDTIKKDLELVPGIIVINESSIMAGGAYSLIIHYKGGMLFGRTIRSGSLSAYPGKVTALVQHADVENLKEAIRKINTGEPLSYRLFSYADNKDIAEGSIIFPAEEAAAEPESEEETEG
jgi:hypothetical protein